MNRKQCDRRKFIRGMSRWVVVPTVAAATACSMQSPTAPDSNQKLQPLTGGKTTTDMKLLDVLLQAHHEINDSNYVKTSGKRRFVGLNNTPGTQWYIYINGVRYGDGLGSGSIVTDMPEVIVPAGSEWRIEQPPVSLGFIPAAALLALGWFSNRRNAVKNSQSLKPATARLCMSTSFPSGGLPPPLPSFFYLLFTKSS